MVSKPIKRIMIMADQSSLFYVIGASGAGKDSVMHYARERLTNDTPVFFAHRYITRPVELTGENHISLNNEEFDSRLCNGCFAMHWHSHDLKYGIGIEINQWLENGVNVVMNGSRAYLEKAMLNYPDLIPVLITVSQEKLEQRLLRRGRENASEIHNRLQRAVAFEKTEVPRICIINNDGPLEESGEEFLQLILNRSPEVKKGSL